MVKGSAGGGVNGDELTLTKEWSYMWTQIWHSKNATSFQALGALFPSLQNLPQYFQIFKLKGTQ